MSFIDRIFKFGSGHQGAQPDIPFGRFSDAYKSEAQQAAFDRALDHFDKEDRLGAYREFFRYLQNDSDEDNITYTEENGEIHFEFWQGSRIIQGIAGPDKVKACSKVAKATDLNVGFLRRLMEANFNLKFSRFALDPENNLCILFDSGAVDASPLKLLHALRELAINADKQDDLLLDEFKSLEPAEKRTYGEIDVAEKEIKYQYIQREIKAAFEILDAGKPDPNQYPGTFAYLLLALAFKLDYLTKPEGFMMDVLEKIHAIYFAKNQLTSQVKVQHIRMEFQKLLDRPKEEFFKEMYRTRSTFGVNPAVTHGSLGTFIEGELANMEWPMQQGYDSLAMAVPQYVVGFTMFHQAPPQPDRELMHLFYQITEAPYFRELGFHIPFIDDKNKLNKSAIVKTINRIVNHHRTGFPKLRINSDHIDFRSDVLFGKSFLLAIKSADLSPANP
ncbi:MAG: hypothetical protein R3A50_14905 [Saprospiraceae bacterium]